MFQPITHIEPFRAAVKDKREIRFRREPNGTTVACYQFMDSKTFDTPEAIECRGIAFDETGAVVSRPLHKFFNVGEKEHLSPNRLAQRTDLVAIFEKLDGSMLATAWVNGALQWRSKKVFDSDIVALAKQFLAQSENAHLQAFAEEAAAAGMTAIFEFMHPLARIVVAVDKPSLRLLHVRDNVTGEYVLLNPAHPIHGVVARHGVERCPGAPLRTVEELHVELESLEGHEGYVLQYADGDMVKWKSAWYRRLHRSVTFLRERDIALSALNGELDDLKGVLAELGLVLSELDAIEHRVKERLLDLEDQIESVVAADKGMERKDFALKHKHEPLFGLMMGRYLGREVDLAQWFIDNRLKEEFSLRVLVDGALAEALEG